MKKIQLLSILLHIFLIIHAQTPADVKMTLLLFQQPFQHNQVAY